MNSGIGSPGARYFYRFFEQLFECVLDCTGDGAALGLRLKSEKRRAVIFNGAAYGML